MPYPGDCSKYQQCDVSGCFVMSCGRGTEFNPAIGTCDYPLRDRSGCSNRGWELYNFPKRRSCATGSGIIL